MRRSRQEERRNRIPSSQGHRGRVASIKRPQDVYWSYGPGHQVREPEFISKGVYAGRLIQIDQLEGLRRTGDLMVNEKVRDAVTDVHILFDTRDISRIGTVLKDPLKWGPWRPRIRIITISSWSKDGPSQAEDDNF